MNTMELKEKKKNPYLCDTFAMYNYYIQTNLIAPYPRRWISISSDDTLNTNSMRNPTRDC